MEFTMETRKNNWRYVAILAVVYGAMMSVGYAQDKTPAAAHLPAVSPKPPVPPVVQAPPEVLQVTELEQAQTDGDLKDFQILQMRFAARIAAIKKAHNWGDEVLYDVQQNKFYRTSKAEPAKPAKK